MRHTSALGALAAVLLTTTAPSARADMVFERIATLSVATNLPADADPETETSAEIISATADGMTLVYTDSPLGALGFIDLTDPANPQPAGVLMLDGEPTSVSVVGTVALIGVNTSESYTEPTGRLDAIDVASRDTLESCDIGGQPDSVAAAKDGSFVAIAIENERDEDLNDGVIPQGPGGFLVLIDLTDGRPDCDTMRTVDLAGLAAVAGSDPEPEFVDVNDAGEVVVSIQENNHMAVVDGATGDIVSHFSAGTVDLDNVDIEEEGALTFDGTLAAVPREPDAVHWIDDARFVTANEGDYQGGSRGFTIFNKDGTVAFESNLSLEYEVARAGHYPEGRSGNKGVEPEGVEVGTFGDTTYIFVGTERAQLIGVYRDTGGEPEFVQLLPSGIGPEGLLALPERGLFVTANETDLIEDGGPRSHVMIYSLVEGAAAYPTITSLNDETGRPIGWGALSGMVADPTEPGRLYAITDSFYELQPQILTIDASQTPASIVARQVVTIDGKVPGKLDLEGIALATDGGFWLASEGRTDRDIPHRILRTDAEGAVVEEVTLPPDLLAHEIRFGFEGVTTTGEGDDLTLWLAVQREWKDDPEGFVKLVSYKPASSEWGAVHYPLDKGDKGWVGLSEITAVGDTVYIVERDNQLGENAVIKRLYGVPLAAMVPGTIGSDLPRVEKTLVHDFLPDLQAFKGVTVDKLEGFAIDAAGNAFAVTDNDGVDDSSGETYFLRLGTI